MYFMNIIDNQRMNNEIEVLIMLNIPPDNFINSLSKTLTIQTLNFNYAKKLPTTKKNVFYLNIGTLLLKYITIN